MKKSLFKDWMRWPGIFLMGILMFSCGDSEDDGNGGNGTNQGETVDEELMPLVGYWESNSSNGRSFLFYDDGTCMSPHPSNGSYSAGKWVYDPETRYLSNTATSQTFMVTMYDETSLLGINIANQETVAFTKNNTCRDALQLIMIDGKWRSTENKDSLSIAYYGMSISNKFPEMPKNSGTRIYDYAEVALSADAETGTFSYQLWWHGSERMWIDGEYDWYDHSWETNYKGSITFKEPFSPSKCRATLTGILEGTYYKDREGSNIFD